MPKPILLAIDDDTSVLEAVVQDLRRHYGQDYRIVRAASGAAALDICRQLQERKDIVALFLSDQRMPGMTGVDLLQQVIPLFPDAKRVLLTAYADTDAAIRAINSAKIHYYLNKPWDPPEEKLYPVLNDLLESWKQGYTPPYEGIRVIGMRWSSASQTGASLSHCVGMASRGRSSESPPSSGRTAEWPEAPHVNLPPTS